MRRPVEDDSGDEDEVKNFATCCCRTRALHSPERCLRADQQLLVRSQPQAHGLLGGESQPGQRDVSASHSAAAHEGRAEVPLWAWMQLSFAVRGMGSSSRACRRAHKSLILLPTDGERRVKATRNVQFRENDTRACPFLLRSSP